MSKSLTYDLFELMKSRSPQKTCHNIAVTLDREQESPFYKMIKRLGFATPGRTGETLSQATVVEPLLSMMSKDPMMDRDAYLRGKKPEKVDPSLLDKHPFQHMFVDERDFEITDIIWNFFGAVRERWPEAWASRDEGLMLNRTNGYKALMRFLWPLYQEISQSGPVPSQKDFLEVLDRIKMRDDDFKVENFRPGSSGESDLFHALMHGAELV